MSEQATEHERPRHPTMTGSGPSVSDRVLDRLERDLSVVLPPSYRAFLKRWNGGRPYPDEFPIGGGPRGSVLNFFFSVDAPNPLFDLAGKARGNADRVPAELLPIGVDAGGSLVCIKVRGPGSGQVYFWSLNSAPYPRDPTSWENVTLVAESFDEFLESFSEE